jgi:hypothetical protein
LSNTLRVKILWDWFPEFWPSFLQEFGNLITSETTVYLMKISNLFENLQKLITMTSSTKQLSLPEIKKITQQIAISTSFFCQVSKSFPRYVVHLKSIVRFKLFHGTSGAMCLTTKEYVNGLVREASEYTSQFSSGKMRKDLKGLMDYKTKLPVENNSILNTLSQIFHRLAFTLSPTLFATCFENIPQLEEETKLFPTQQITTTKLVKVVGEMKNGIVFDIPDRNSNIIYESTKVHYNNIKQAVTSFIHQFPEKLSFEKFNISEEVIQLPTKLSEYLR